MRVPLLRPGFRPDGPYTVVVRLSPRGHARSLKKGDMQMTLPQMDVPVSVVEWELFVPDQYRADRFSGTAIAAHLDADPPPGTEPITSAGLARDRRASSPASCGAIESETQRVGRRRSAVDRDDRASRTPSERPRQSVNVARV